MQLTDNAPILYGASPRVIHHGYSVITTRVTNTSGNEHRAALVAYCGPNGSTKGVLLRQSDLKTNPAEAVANLLESMERELGSTLSQTALGETIPFNEGPYVPRNVPKGPRQAKIVKPGPVQPTHIFAPVPQKPIPILRKSLSHSSENSSMLKKPQELFEQRLMPQNNENIEPAPIYKPYRPPAQPVYEGYKAYRPPPPPAPTGAYKPYREKV